MNMRVLKPSRKKVKPGDIFVLQQRDDEYIFGRVIRTDIDMLWSNQILVYIYQAFSSDKNSIPELCKEKFLVSPVITYWEMWLDGYFETIAHRELIPEEVWSEHCFYDHGNGWYYDEDNKRMSLFHAWRLKLSGVPCGKVGLVLSSGIDHEISRALGIPISYD